MPSTSAAGALTAFTLAAATMVDRVRLSLEEAVLEVGATGVTAAVLAEKWYVLPLDEMAEAIVACAKPPTHLPLATRKAMPQHVQAALENNYARLCEAPVISERKMVAEHVAADLVKSLVGASVGAYVTAVQEASTTYWNSRRDDDGRVTTGTTPSGRRQRSDVRKLIAQDRDQALNVHMKIRYQHLRTAIGSGAHRREVRATRMLNGLSGQQVQALMYHASRAGTWSPFDTSIAFNITAWENSTLGDNPDGSAKQPRTFYGAWPHLAQALQLDPNINDGPLVPVVTAPTGSNW